MDQVGEIRSYDSINYAKGGFVVPARMLVKPPGSADGFNLTLPGPTVMPTFYFLKQTFKVPIHSHVFLLHSLIYLHNLSAETKHYYTAIHALCLGTSRGLARVIR